MDKKIEVMPTRRQVLEDLDFLERLYELRGKDDIINWILNEYDNPGCKSGIEPEDAICPQCVEKYRKKVASKNVCFCCEGKDDI